jgi:uncharacterized protein
LLDLQDLDLQLDQVAHKRKSLPEHAALAELAQEKSVVDHDLVTADTEVSDLQREQKKADADVEQVRLRRARNQQRLDSGQVSSPRDLEGLQHEIGSLERRISDLEDAELEVMEQLEGVRPDRRTCAAGQTRSPAVRMSWSPSGMPRSRTSMSSAPLSATSAPWSRRSCPRIW